MQNKYPIFAVFKFLCASIGFFHCSHVLAVERAGNGGSVVVCPAVGQTPRSVEMLDDYEGRTLWGFSRSAAAPAEDPVALAKSYAMKLAQFQPMRSTRMLAALEHFMENTKFLSGAELAILPDSIFLAFRAGCMLQQIAIQREPLFPEDRFFNISQDLWNQLDVNGKATLLLHEVIYREATSRGATDSRTSRYFNEFISSTKMDSISPEKFEAVAGKIGFSETLPPKPLSDLAEKLRALLINRTVYRNNTSAIGTSTELETTYSDLLVGGRKLTFVAHETEIIKKSMSGTEVRRTLDRLFTVRLMNSTQALLAEVTLKNTDDYDSTRGSSTGNFRINPDGSLVWNGTTLGYGDRTDISGQFFAAQEDLQTTWSLQNGSLLQTSQNTLWNYDPLLQARTSKRSESTIISKELKVQ